MSLENYQANELSFIIDSLILKKSVGALILKTEVKSWQHQRKCILFFRQGKLIFGDNKIPNISELGLTIGKRTNSQSINSALTIAEQKANNSQSYQKLIDLLIKMNVFTWEDVKAFILERIILNLEILLTYPGKSQWQENYDFDLFTGEDKSGLDWSEVKKQLNLRQHKWNKLKPEISGIDQIPVLVPEKLPQINDVKIKKHLQKMVDGKRNLLDIADKVGKDPYKVSKIYYGWLKNGWIHFGSISSNNQHLPIVLSLDDSPIIQTMIKRSLSGICDVILTDQATKAMEVLNRLPVKLLLLDLTLPNVDGLEFCQTIRKIPKFRDLPIVMVTGRDTLVDRAKGRFAGSNQYLTKPFKPEELRDIARQYI